MQYCVCGKKMESITAPNPWQVASYDSKGKLIEGICLHGIKIKSQPEQVDDTKFIDHIKSHLKEGQEVICKICGKTAKEILNETKV